MQSLRKLLLAVDVGNTNTHFGVFDGETLKEKFQMSTIPDAAKFEKLISKQMDKKEFDVVIGSVVPQVTVILRNYFENRCAHRPLLVSHKLPLGIRFCYEKPENLGADRIANVIGGFNLYGGPLLVVGFGTAITFDVVNKRGDFIGGAIAPGLNTMLASLNKNTAQLPKVSLGKGSPIGHDTKTSIEYGVAHGADGLVKEIIRSLKSSCKIHVRLKMVATGGDAAFFHKRLPFFDYVNPDLTLVGLREIFDRVKGRVR